MSHVYASRNGAIHAQYARRPVRQHGGAWQINSKARLFLDAGISPDYLEQLWEQAEQSGDSPGLQKDHLFRELARLTGRPESSFNTIDVVGAEIKNTADAMRALQREAPQSKPPDSFAAAQVMKDFASAVAAKVAPSSFTHDSVPTPYGPSPATAVPFRPGAVEPRPPVYNPDTAPMPSAPIAADVPPMPSAPRAADVPAVPSAAQTADAAAVVVQTNDAAALIESTIAQEGSLSPYQKTQLMVQLMQSPVLTQMVKLGLLKWSDLVTSNDGSYKDPDGTQPDLMLDMAALGKIKDQLRQAAVMQEQRSISDVIIRQRERTVPGPKASSYGPFPGKTVYMGPRYLPGRLPNSANVVLV